jgi:CheY-like chemotaxis protein
MDSPLTFLLVDDDIALCSLMRDFFGQEGYRTECVNDGREALAVLTARSFDLVILDVMMPVLNGFEVLQQLRKRSGVPVIMLTARTASVPTASAVSTRLPTTIFLSHSILPNCWPGFGPYCGEPGKAANPRTKLSSHVASVSIPVPARCGSMVSLLRLRQLSSISSIT